MVRRADYFLKSALNAREAANKYSALMNDFELTNELLLATVIQHLCIQSQLQAEFFAEVIGRMDSGYDIDLEFVDNGPGSSGAGTITWRQDEHGNKIENSSIQEGSSYTDNTYPWDDDGEESSSEAPNSRSDWYGEVHGSDDPTR